MKQLEVAGYMYLRLSQLSGQLLLLGQLQTVNHFTLITTVIFDFCVSLSVFSLSLSPWSSGSKQIPTPSVRGEVFDCRQ